MRGSHQWRLALGLVFFGAEGYRTPPFWDARFDVGPLSFTGQTLIVFGACGSFLQAFIMGLLFFISGYFTPRSLDRKGLFRFISDRFVRLGLPTLIYMLMALPGTSRADYPALRRLIYGGAPMPATKHFSSCTFTRPSAIQRRACG